MAPPPSFGDLGKDAADLFSRDYTFGSVKAEIKSKTSTGVELKTTGNHDMETGRAAGDLETKYVFKDYGITFTEKWKTSNVVTAEVAVEDKLVKGLKNALEANFEPNTGKKSAKLKNTFKAANANLGVDLEFKSNLPTIVGSGVFGYQNFFGGINVGYDTERQKLTKLNYGLAYKLKDFCLYGGVENGTNFSGSVYQKLSESLETGVKFSWTSNTHATDFGVATKYKLEGDSFFKLKVDNSSMVGTAYSFKVNDGVRVTLCGNFDGKSINAGGHRLGMALSFES